MTYRNKIELVVASRMINWNGDFENKIILKLFPGHNWIEFTAEGYAYTYQGRFWPTVSEDLVDEYLKANLNDA